MSMMGRSVLERDIVVLLPWHAALFAAKHGKGFANALAGGLRLDHLVNEPTLCGHERIGEPILIIFGALRDF